MAHRIGQQLGNYHLNRLVGAGGFAEVYLGEHIHLGTLAAVKVLDRQLTDEGIERFRNEARTIARLEHPNIVRVLDFGIEDHTPFLVMSYAPNGSLHEHHVQGSPLPLKHILSYVKQVAAALQYAHEMRVIHRDVKPQNMLLGRNYEVLLGDFGLAAIAHTERSLSTQEMAGTIPYMAPEQIQGKPRPASDQYALGVVVYEWLCGVRPFQGAQWEIMRQHMYVPPPPLREKTPAIPQAVEEVVLKALAKDPQERFASVQDFAAALEQESQVAEPLNVTFPLIQSSSTTLMETSPSSFAPSVDSTSPTREGHSLPKQSAIDENILAEQELSSKRGPSALAPHDIPPAAAIVPPSEVSLASSASSPGHASMSGLSDISSDRPTTLSTSPQLSLPATRPSQPGFPNWKATLLIGVALLVIAGLLSSSISKWIASFTPHPTPNTTAPSYSAMFGFNPQHTHFNPDEKTLSPANVSRLMLYWMQSTGAAIWSSPAVTNGRVYVGSNDHKLYAIDSSNGNVLWTATTGAEIQYSSPAVVNGVVYVGSNDHKLYAFNASNGKPLWTATTGDAVDSSPTVANGVVYIGSRDLKLYAFKASGCGNPTCEPLWTASTDESILSSPAVANGIVYVSTQAGTLYAFDVSTHAQLWTIHTKAAVYIQSSPTVANGIVYVGSDNQKLYAVDASTGSVRWTAPIGGLVESSPAVANGVVYVGSFDSNLYAFDASTGKPLWTATIANGDKSSPVVANGIVYVGSGDHQLYAFNASGCGRLSCPPLWTTSTGAEIESSPVVTNDVVYVSSLDGKLYAFHVPGTRP